MSYIEINTLCGKIKGIETETHLEFRGLRYAKANRFEYPVIVDKWADIYDATEYGACCFQHRAFENDAEVNPFYHKEFRKGLSFTYSEDCQFLNIWAPKKAKNCPVLIFIHGGSFTGGSADEGHISGKVFAEKGIITVAINYRLGPYGFCSHPDLTDKKGVCGNYGLFDQAAAIQWTINNIESFGGDPKKITLMGQSAGAMSVDIHLSNPFIKDKISGTILLSGAGLQRCAIKPVSPPKTEVFWQNVMAKAGVGSAEELKTVDAKILYYAWRDTCKEVKNSMPFTFPVYDGALLKEGSFGKKNIADVPCLIGTTCTDMFPVLLEFLTKSWVKNKQKNGSAPCFTYNFNRFLPGDDMGAWHCADLLYAFSTLDFNWRPFEEIDYKISKQLSDAIVAFTKTGDPNCSSLPQWKVGYKKPMSFSESSKCESWHTKDNFRYTFNGKGKTI